MKHIFPEAPAAPVPAVPPTPRTVTFTYQGLPLLGMTFDAADLPGITPEDVADIEQHVSRTLAPKWALTSRTVSETGPVQLGGAA